MKISSFITLLGVALCSLPAHAAPAISIGALYEYLDPQKSTLLKRVSNISDNTAFVKVSVSEMVFNGDEPSVEQEVPAVKHGKDEHQPSTLVASPARLIIPGNGMQAVRLLSLGPREKERYYRVRFAPVMPVQGDDFGMDKEQTEKYKDSLSAGVFILAGYGAVMVVRPSEVHYQTEIKDEANRWSISNKGNSIIVMDAFYDCKRGSDDCAPPTVHHVLPQRTKVFEKEAGRHYRFQLIEGDRKKSIELGN